MFLDLDNYKNSSIVKTFNFFFSILAGLFITISCGNSTKSGKTGKVGDIDGNVYATITIGTQTWMAENLKTTKYNDGMAIPNISVDTTWTGCKTGAYCWYNNDSTAYKATYGAFYNWQTVKTGKLCPTGWHVPSDAEWRALTNYLGNEMVAGIELKTTTGWSKNGNGTNTSGFTGVPCGYRNYKGSFGSHGSSSYWWSSSVSGDNAWYCVLFAGDATANKYYGRPQSGFSVRCLKSQKSSN